jgi:hypothetical protein
LLYAVQVQCQRTESGIVGVWECINHGVHRVSAHSIVVHARSVDEFVVKLHGKQRVGKFTEELLQQASNTIDIMLEGFWVSEVYL